LVCAQLWGSVLKLTIIGSGDAFCSGGRLQAAFLLEAGAAPILVDCGATTLLGLERLGIEFDRIPYIAISHLHGDHFGGLLWCLMHAALVTRRTSPLDIYGPPGLEARVSVVMEAFYPGMAPKLAGLLVRYHVIEAGKPMVVGGVRMTAIEVDHPSGAPSFGFRFERNGKVFAYSGDSQWTESLVDIGRNADLYLVECYKSAGTPLMHLSWEQIAKNIERFGARRLVLTHMSNEMLRHRDVVKDPRVSFADDGAVYEF
jgi:ribonuclease BN (tRNA processing enzyme)